MTCIVAVKKLLPDGSTRIYMGGDSAGVAGLDITIRKDPKVFKNGEFLIGFTTSFRMGQLIRFKFDPPTIPDDMDVYEYMVVHFVDTIRTALKDGGFAQVSNGVEKGGHFIVGLRGRLFTIESDFQVGENQEDYAAAGCGADYAIGALAVLHDFFPNMSGEQLVEHALKVAAGKSAGVRAPFMITSSADPETPKRRPAMAATAQRSAAEPVVEQVAEAAAVSPVLPDAVESET